ncbi:MAG: DUF1573 domain-containing protein [Anaerolineales bacterium]
MSSIPRASRSRIAQRRQEAKWKTRLVLGIAILGGLLVVGAVLLAVTDLGGSSAGARVIEYTEAQVARANPIMAVHEMEAGPPIPYLPASSPQPSIAVSEEFVNVGSVGPTEVIERKFVIANTGEGPLTISRAYTTCGCTTAEISSATIPAGQVAEVNLIFDAGFHDTRGQVVRRGLIIENNDPEQPVREIWIEASVKVN